MSDSTDKESKTEEATEKKVRDAVEKGNIPSSREALLLASFAAILIYLVFIVSGNIMDLASFLSAFLEKPEEWPISTAEDVGVLYRVVFIEIARSVAVILILLVVAGIGASVLQNMPQFVGERIRPQASRISPVKGWTRLFGAAGLVEFLKSLAKLILALVVVVYALKGVHATLLSGMLTPPGAFALVIRDTAIHIVFAITFVMGVIAVADLVWQRFHWRQELRMTRQEIKDEMKQAEGDPIIKSRLRSLARDRARQRMMAAVPKATLVIANPTHYSIALRYVREQDAAPMVLAKGQDLVALKIREIAEANGIPVFEDVALARSMYKQVSVDSMIPPQFYQAVAELVRVVYGKGQRKVQP
ncbi:MAG: flagellar biosynthesis protein FlhB [Rhizobiaceae bacterium]|nr:flagellar biosynthesis protein FlhB [Rhizobiaceae bacterium]